MRTASAWLLSLLTIASTAADAPPGWREVTVGEALAAAGRTPAQEPLAIPWLGVRVALPPAQSDPQRDLRWCAWRLGLDEIDGATDARATRIVRAAGDEAIARLYDVGDVLAADTRAADLEALRRLAAADGDAAAVDGHALVVRAHQRFHARLERLLGRLRAGALAPGEPLWTEAGDDKPPIAVIAALEEPWRDGAATAPAAIDTVIAGLRRAGLPLLAAGAVPGDARLDPPPASGERLRAVVDRVADAVGATWRIQDGLVLLAPRGVEPTRWRALWLPARDRASVEELVRAIAVAVGGRPGAVAAWRGGALVLAAADAATIAAQLATTLDAGAPPDAGGF